MTQRRIQKERTAKGSRTEVPVEQETPPSADLSETDDLLDEIDAIVDTELDATTYVQQGGE